MTSGTGLAEIHNPLKQLKILWMKRCGLEFQVDIQEADRRGDGDEVDRLMKLKQEKMREIQSEIKAFRSELRISDEPAERE